MDASTPPPRPGTGPHERTDAASSLEHSKAAGGSATVDAQLRVGAGFGDDERPGIVGLFGSLDSRLRGFAAVDVDMELSIKDRDRPGQKVTLECWIARMPRFVATSHLDDFDAALIEVRDDMRRQINDAKTKSEPRNSRQGRETVRGPD